MFGSGYDIILMMLMMWSGYKASSRIDEGIEYNSLDKEDTLKLMLKKILVFSMPLILIVLYSMLGLVDAVSVIMASVVYSFIKIFESMKELRDLEKELEKTDEEINKLENEIKIKKNLNKIK